MATWLGRHLDEPVNRKRMQRLMRTMRIEAIYPRQRTTLRNLEHRVFPYLLRDLAITRKDQVWSTDITYIPLRDGYMYLVAVMDWHTRYVLSWRLSNTLEGHFCIEALEDSLAISTPEIFNTDQGCQFTSRKFTSVLEGHQIAISMDGRGRALDNVFIERLWRTVKYEDIYLKDYETVRQLSDGLRQYFQFYCHDVPIHRSGNARRCRCIRKVAADAARVIRKDEGDPLEASKNTSKCFDSLESEPSRR